MYGIFVADRSIETPWLHQMSSFAKGHDPGLPKTTLDQSPVTIASFSPGQTASRGKQRRTVLVQHKSPLLTATPPQITRALAFSHPFILPLNKLVGLISWSSGDPWESFLIIAVFWALTIYGGVLVRLTGPILVVVILILGMYSRRYSPLSSTGWTGEKVKNQKRDEFDGTTSHQKSLDEIVDTLNVFTYRCNILLSPLLGLTDFLSTQRTATSATTRPALTTLLIRILMLSPLWVTLSMTPFNIITTPRVVLAVGTLGLSWHSRPARISRTILWRSITIRKAVSALTGLDFEKPISDKSAPPLPPRNKSQYDLASSIASTGTSSDNGVRFTFTVYENQRRWLGLGWTSSMFAYERTPWSDEHLNPSASKEEFLLPTVENGNAVWQWVPGSDWHFESTKKSSVLVEASKSSSEGWIYYDNKVSGQNIHDDSHNSNVVSSGLMDADKMAGVDTRDVGNGTGTRNLLREHKTQTQR